MQVSLTCICRGNGKAYALFEIDDVKPDDTIAASCSLKSGKPVIFQQIDLSSELGKREIVVAFPLSPHTITIALSCFGKNVPESSKIIFSKSFSPGYVKWASRLNYRIHRETAYKIRDCEKDNALTCDEIEIIGLVPMDNKTVYRCRAIMPNAQKSNHEIKVLNDKFKETEIEVIEMGSAEIPKGMESPIDKQYSVFSINLPGHGVDYTVALFRNGKLSAFETISKYRFGSLLEGYENATQTASLNPNYENWRQDNVPHGINIITQSEIEFEYSPLISIIVPLYNTPLNYFVEMTASVTGQSYSNWELVLVNSTPDNIELSRAIDDLSKSDRRIKALTLKENRGIAENTKAGMKIAEGDFIAFLDHDDIIAPNALYEYVFALNLDRKIDIFYSDSDHIDRKGNHVNPYFKPDFSLFLMREINYMCHFRMVRKTILDEIEFGDSKFDGAQDHDMLLKCLERTNHVFHCPKMLYSWRMAANSTAASLDNKPYANTAAKLAIEEHLKRLAIKADVVDSEDACRFHTLYKVSGNPKVSILIPSKDNVDILANCVQSILDKSTYANFEIIVIENNSVDPATFAYYDKLKSLDNRVRVITWESEFNYSKINNFGVDESSGDYLLFLNNDTEVITNSWIERLLGICQQDNVGAVGAKLFYPDGTIQHGGVYVQGDGAGHININLSREAHGYFNTAFTTREVSAVTAACLMCPRNVFLEVNGFDPDFAVAFNDVDLCMKIKQADYKVIFNPNCMLYHYESISRGYETTMQKILRFTKESSLLKYKWSDQYVLGDPYMNINLNPNSGYFNLPEIYNS